MTTPSLRSEVIRVYKGAAFLSGLVIHLNTLLLTVCLDLLYLGRDYPLGFSSYRTRLHQAFASKAGLTDVREIRKAIEQARYVQKGMHDSDLLLS